MDAFDSAVAPMNSLSPGASQASGDAFDTAGTAPMASTPDAFDSAPSPDWGTLAHGEIAKREAANGPLNAGEKVAVMQAYRAQYGQAGLPQQNETLPQLAAKTAADNSFLQNASSAFGGALSRGATGAVGLVSPSTGQALREDQLGAYGMAQQGSTGEYVGDAVGGAVASAPAMFGGPAGLLLSGIEAAGNKRIDIADQRANGASIGGGREALAALGSAGVDVGSNLLAQKLLGHVGGRIMKSFGGEIAGALEAGDAGGAAQAIAKMLGAEFGKEVAGNQAIGQLTNLANNAIAKITKPGVPLTQGAGQAAASALVQSILLSPLSPLMHGMGAHGGEGANPTPEQPADYSPLTTGPGFGPNPQQGTVGKRMYASSDDVAAMFKLGEQDKGSTPPPANDAHPAVLNSPSHVGEYYAKTYGDADNAATIEAMASMNPGRFVKAQVPIDQIEPGVLGEADKSQEKIDQLAAMTPEQRQALNPGILIQQRDGKFMPADGTHRFMGASQAGDTVYNAYVPESAIGKNGVVPHPGNQPAEASPVEAPATGESSADTRIGGTQPAPESQPLPSAEHQPAQTVQTDTPAVAAARKHFPDLLTFQPQTREQKEAAAVAKQLGADAVFYNGGHEGRGFVLKDHPDTVFISAASNRGVDAIRQAVGHELTRSLARTSPEQFKPILDAIPDADLSAAEKEYRAKLEASGKNGNGVDVHESAAALTLGKAAMKERVWRAMSGKNPTTFEAFAGRVSEVFGRLTDKGRTLNKIVEAWDRVRPELEAKANANESASDVGTVPATERVAQSDERAQSGIPVGGRTETENRQGESVPRESAGATAVPAADEAAQEADVTPPRTVKEAKARKSKATPPAEPPKTEANGRVPIDQLKYEKTPVGFDSAQKTAERAREKARAAYQAASDAHSRLQAGHEGSAEFKQALKDAAKGLRGNEAARAKNAARAKFLEAQPDYKPSLNKLYTAQDLSVKARDAVDSLESDRVNRIREQGTKDDEAFKAKLRQYPWFDLEKFINSKAGAGDEAGHAKEVLNEKLNQMQRDSIPPAGSEILAKPSKAPPPATVKLPRGQQMETPPYAASMLDKRGQVEATHATEPATEANIMEARKYMVDKFGSNEAVRALKKAADTGATNFKQFIRTVPEFARDPKLVNGEDGFLSWNDANGGSFKFAPEHLGILPAGEMKPGDTISVDPETVKTMKKGDTLIIKPGESGAAPSDLALLPSASAIARGAAKAGPNFFNQDVIPTIKNGAKAVVDALKAADRFISGSALDQSADDTKEHLREAWAKNDLDRIRTEAFFKPAAKLADKYSKPATVQMVEAIESGQPAPDPKMQPFVDAIRNVNARLAAKAAAVGINISKWTPDYVGRIFEFPDDKGGGSGWTSSIAGAEHYLKGRVFDNFGDALKFVESVGGKLKYPNFVEMQLAKWEEVRKGIRMRQEFSEAVQRGDVSLFGAREKLPDGWKYLDDKLATLHAAPEWRTLPNGRTVQTDHVMGKYAAPEAIANVFNDNLAPGLYQKLPLWKRWAQANHFLTSLNLGLSGAHMMNMATGGAGVSFAQAADNLIKFEWKDAGKNALRGLTAPIYHAWNGSRVRQAAQVAGSVPGLERLVDATVAGGGRFGFDSILDKGSAQKALDAFKAGNPIAGTLHGTAAAWKALSYPLFKMYIPNIKASLMATAAETELQRAQSRDELRESMGRHSNAIDNVLGEVVHDNKFQHRMVQDAMQGIFLAPNWNEGLARLVGGSARDYVRAAIDMRNGKSPTVTPNMLIPFGAVMAHMAFSAAINRALSGQWPQSYRDYFQPRTGQKDNDGNDMRVNLLTPFKDIPSWLTAPQHTLWNKLSPLIHMAHDIGQNSDYHGVEIYHPGDTLGEKAGEVAKYVGKAALPFSVQSYERMKDVGADAKRKALGFAGLNPVPNYVANTDAEKLARELHISQQPPGTRTQEQYDQSELVKRLAQSIRSNQPGAGQAARDALKAHQITDENYVDMMTTKNQPYLQRTVKKLGAEDAMRVWNVADDKEKRTLVNDMIAKIGDAKEWDNKPDLMKKYLLELRDERIRLKKTK